MADLLEASLQLVMTGLSGMWHQSRRERLGHGHERNQRASAWAGPDPNAALSKLAAPKSQDAFAAQPKVDLSAKLVTDIQH
jgi:hypothetical protein